MEKPALKRLKRKIYILFPSILVITSALLFMTAGSFKYWEGWLFIAVIFLPALLVTFYFLKRSPEFLERRLMYREKEAKQKSIIKLANILFILGLTITGLDHRFGWSKVPLWLVIMSNVFILAGYYLIFLAFKENPFAARTIEVFKDQKVIDTGPYAIIRHPIYAGTIPMFLCIPLALGSFWAISVFISLCVIIILRTLNEEEVLNRDLPGYRAYCEKIRYRLVPLIW